MTQFATASDLEDRLGIDLSAAEKTRAGKLLTHASSLIQQAARQAIEKVENDTLTRRGSRESAILLPERPVISVSSVTLDGVSLAETTDWYLQGDELVRASGRNSFLEGGEIRPSANGWGHPGVELEIVYTHGFDPVPDAIKAICVEAVTRVWVNPGAVAQEGHGSERVSYGATGLTLTREEKRDVRSVVSRGSRSENLK